MAAAAVNPPAAPLLGLELLERLAAEFPPRYLVPSSDLSRIARDASVHLFSALIPSVSKPLPSDRLLAAESFDAEQIWHQIDLQSQPLTRSLRRDLKPFEKMYAAGEVKGLFVGKEEEVDDEEEQEEVQEQEEDDGGEENDSSGGEEEEDEEEGKGDVLDDGFFKSEELEKFLDNEDEREFGGKQSGKVEEEDSEDEDMTEDEDSDNGAYARYGDFYLKKKDKVPVGDSKKNEKARKRSKRDEGSNMEEIGESSGESEMSNAESEQNEGDVENENDGIISTFEMQSIKNQSKIEQIEKELIAPKSWTMMGEVTAFKRPKNSALEVDLDFQHNRVHAPISIEENDVSIEELIIKRLREGPGHLDEVQRSTLVEVKASRELKELDDKKSQKGLAEIYEEEYVQKTDIGNAPSLSDELKMEASLLFKKLCIKLDALSHFRFKPKPVIEEMSIQTSVPALAMEEIAPLAVSDAAMLAPEEIFAGKGDVKEDAELTKADRKQRRAKKKRKFKAISAKRPAKKSRVHASPV